MSTAPQQSAQASQPITPLTQATRRRLQEVFERGKASQQRGDREYAHQLFSECVSEDPGSILYAQQMWENLGPTSPQGKRSMLGSLRGRSAPAALTRAAARGAWRDAFAAGCAALGKNPADIATLLALADCCGQVHTTESQLFYLRCALELEPKDVEVNRAAAAALEGVAQFEQAINCWRRVAQQKPSDVEATNAIARLCVEQTIQKAGYNTELLHGSAEVAPLGTARVADFAISEGTGPQSGTEASLERLRAEIAASPTEIEPRLKLAQALVGRERLEEAAALLAETLAVSGGSDPVVLERCEDLELRRMIQQVLIAEQRARDLQTPDAEDLARNLRGEAVQRELQVYAARADRSPSDPRAQFDLAIRLKKLGKKREAIPVFQRARADRKRAAEVNLHLGECFQHIEQYKLALAAYEGGIDSCGPGQEETLKLLLYRAGVLATGMREFEKAERHLTRLAGIDFAYRDVGDRLDKLEELRQNP